MKLSQIITCASLLFITLTTARAQEKTGRQMELLNGADWQFIGAGDTADLPKIGSDGFTHAAWANVLVPHNFQARTAYNTITRGWDRRKMKIDPFSAGRELSLVFEGAASMADVYYLYRCFLRSDAPTVWITSKRYFLRGGSVNNGIKVYSNAPLLTLTLNGEKVSTIENGNYVIPNGLWIDHNDKRKKGAKPAATQKLQVYTPEKIDNVFYWPVPLHTGKNEVTATDEQGHSDTATTYFYGDNGLPEIPDAQIPITALKSSNSENPAHFMNMPVRAQ